MCRYKIASASGFAEEATADPVLDFTELVP